MSSNELYADPDFTEVTVAHNRRNSKKSSFWGNPQNVLTAGTLCVAIAAIVVGSIAISRTNESNEKQEKVNNQQKTDRLALANTASAANGASTIISTMPFCSASATNRQACLNVIAAGEKMIADIYNTNISTADVTKGATNQNYRVDFKEEGIANTLDAPGSHTMADGVVTDGNGHILGPDGNAITDASGAPVTSKLFDVNECLLVWKEKLCFALVPIGDTVKEVEEARKRRSGENTKWDLPQGNYIPVVHVTDGMIVKGKDGKLRRAGGKRSAAIMGCLGGVTKGAGAGAAMGGAVGTIFPGIGNAMGAAVGGLAGGALGCAAGGGWLGRR